MRDNSNIQENNLNHTMHSEHSSQGNNYHSKHTQHMSDQHKENHAEHNEITHEHHVNHTNHNQHGNHDRHDHHNHDHHDHHDHSHHGNFKKLFLISLIPGILLMVISPMMGVKLPFQFTFPYSDILAVILATLLLVIGGKPFFSGLISEFKQKSPGMMSLVSLGLGVSYIYSVVAVILRYVSNLETMDFFFEFASLILIMLLGHWLEMKAISKAGSAEDSLLELLPKSARLVQDDNSIKEISISEIKKGDVLEVQAGEGIPADAKIIEGETRVNEALLTGESKAVYKTIGDQVIAGSTNGENRIKIKVSSEQNQSYIYQVKNLLNEAQAQGSRSENLANKISGYLFYIAIFAALISFVVWSLSANLSTGIMYLVTTLVIACPHALGLAIPLVMAKSSSLGAKHGILLKNREAYSIAEEANVIVLDKTGTLTDGEFKVMDLQIFSDRYNDSEIYSLLAGIESGSSHPIAQAIVKHVKDKGINIARFESSETITGVGIAGTYENSHYELISLKSYNEKVYRDDLQIKSDQAYTSSVLTKNNEAIAVVSLGDQIKDSSYSLVKSLKDNGLQIIMATGDNEAVAKSVADKLGINYLAQQRPEDKYKLIQKLQSEDKKVIMLGDGVNDAPALKLANLGVAIGTGTKVALDSADVILLNSEPKDLEAFLKLANQTQRKVKQNLFWGAGYNFLAIPLAAGALAWAGITITPAIGAVLMSLSTIIVAVNAMSLNLKD